MGEIADMMLEGILCEGCGEYLGEGLGFPTRCAGCSEDYPDAERVVSVTVDTGKPARCPDCDRRFKNGNALGMHWDAKHGGEQ